MTVADLIKKLADLPQDAPVRVEAYYPDTPDEPGAGAVFEPSHVEALSNDDLGVFAVIWASGVTE